MPGLEVWDVDTGGTGDYADLAAAESAKEADLPTTDKEVYFRTRASDGSADSSTPAFSNWVTDATHRVYIVGVENHGHEYNTKTYRLTDGDANYNLDFPDGGGCNDAAIENIQIGRHSTNNRGVSFGMAAGNHYVRGCIFYKDTGTSHPAIWANLGSTYYVQNTIIYGLSTSARWGSGINSSSGSAATIYCKNCLIDLCQGDGGYVTQNASDTMEVVNCIATNCAGKGFRNIAGSFMSSSDHNVDDGGTAPGPHSQNLDAIPFAHYGQKDFRLVAPMPFMGRDLRYDPSDPVTKDLVGKRRPNAAAEWDVGPFQRTRFRAHRTAREFVAAGAPAIDFVGELQRLRLSLGRKEMRFTGVDAEITFTPQPVESELARLRASLNRRQARLEGVDAEITYTETQEGAWQELHRLRKSLGRREARLEGLDAELTYVTDASGYEIELQRLRLSLGRYEARIEGVDAEITFTIEGELDQTSFRGRADDGTEVTATWLDAADTDFTHSTGDPFRLRFLVTETSGVAKSNVTVSLEARRHDGVSWGDWFDVNMGSAYVRVVTTQLVDGDDTTQQLGGGTFIATNAGQDGLDGRAGGVVLDFAGSDEVELEFGLELLESDLNNADQLQFRLVTV